MTTHSTPTGSATLIALVCLAACGREGASPRYDPQQPAAPPTSVADRLSRAGRESFERLLHARRFTDDAYRGSTERVFFQTGCEGLASFPVSELVDHPGTGVVRLTGDQTVKDWLATRGNPDGSAGGYHCDILGGGWPHLFRAAGGWHPLTDADFSGAGD